jgi:hypothetical protein
LGQPFDGGCKQERRDLEVEHRILGTVHRRTDSLMGPGIGKVGMYVRESRREPLEDRVIQLLASAGDRLPRALHELINSPVAGRHTNDGALEKPALFQPVQRSECHYLGQVSGDTEDHEDIGLLLSESRRTVASHHRRPPEPDWANSNPDRGEPEALSVPCHDAAAKQPSLSSPHPGDVLGTSESLHGSHSGALIGNGSSKTGLIVGCLVGGAIMALGRIIEVAFGLKPEGRSLEASPSRQAPSRYGCGGSSSKECQWLTIMKESGS